MRIVLLTLSGDVTRARDELSSRYNGADVITIERQELESKGGPQRISAVCSLRPDIFAVATERLVWQRGQNAFMLLGALAGAHKTIVVDAHGGWKEQGRVSILTKAPMSLAREAAISMATMKRAQRELQKLETAATRERVHQEVERDSDRLKLVYLRSSPGPGSQAGGAASHITGVINATLQLGHHVSLISNDEIAGLDASRVSMKIIWPEPVGSTRAAFDVYNNLIFSAAATSEIERARPHLIYQRYARFSWAGVAASLQSGRPLFLEYNGSEVWVGRHWDRVDMLDLLARYEQLNLKTATRIFVVSEVERANLLRAGISPEKIIVNPNGVDADRFKPDVGGRQLRADLGIEADEVVAGFIGTFGPWHGVEVLATAITKMPADRRLRFLLIGSGALRGKVEKIVKDHNAEERVIMTGPVSHDRVPALLDACDILVSPHVPLADGSDFFGSPTKLFEYMAMGKGIVASRLGQIGDVLVDEETALLVEPGNVSELTNAILRLADSPELRSRLGAAARLAAVERHTWKQNAQRVIDAYEALEYRL